MWLNQCWNRTAIDAQLRVACGVRVCNPRGRGKAPESQRLLTDLLIKLDGLFSLQTHNQEIESYIYNRWFMTSSAVFVCCGSSERVVLAGRLEMTVCMCVCVMPL